MSRCVARAWRWTPVTFMFLRRRCCKTHQGMLGYATGSSLRNWWCPSSLGGVCRRWNNFPGWRATRRGSRVGEYRGQRLLPHAAKARQLQPSHVLGDFIKSCMIGFLIVVQLQHWVAGAGCCPLGSETYAYSAMLNMSQTHTRQIVTVIFALSQG